KALSGLTGLHLSASAATDDHLAVLQDLPALQELLLNETKVTDAGFDHLAACKGLQEVNLARTKVTAAGLKKLAAALPLCKIRSDQPDIDPSSPIPAARPAIAALIKAGVEVHTPVVK